MRTTRAVPRGAAVVLVLHVATGAVVHAQAPRPEFSVGPLTVEPKLTVLFDLRGAEAAVDVARHDWRARRAGVAGRLTRHVEFELEHDVFPGGRWRDAYVGWRTWRPVEARVGRFKMPFGIEALTSIADLEFAERSLVSSTVAPARDTGVMLSGRTRGGAVSYSAGLFAGDGDNALGHRRSSAFRVRLQPLRKRGTVWRTLRIGAAMTRSDVPEGLFSAAGTTVLGHTFFERVYVLGPRTRGAIDVTFDAGPLRFSAEWMQVREARRQQGLRMEDLPDLRTTGWYTSATWRPIEKPRWDTALSVRRETIGFRSAREAGPATTNPRAAQLARNREAVWTLGLSARAWTPVRLMINGIRERIVDPSRAPRPGRAAWWSAIARVQFSL